VILRFFEGTEHQYRRVHRSRLGVLNGGVADGSKVSFVDAVDLDIDDPALPAIPASDPRFHCLSERAFNSDVFVVHVVLPFLR
jgi:hypothetical protein